MMPQIRYDLYTRAFSIMLRVERRRRRWKAIDLGKRVGVTGAGVSAWETAHCTPSFGNIVKIAEAFKVDLSDMMRAVENVARVLEKQDADAAKSASSGEDPEG